MKSNKMELKKYDKEINTLENILGLLVWDASVNMKSKGSEDRASQIGLIAGYMHELLTSEKVKKALEELEREELKGEDKFYYEKFKKKYDKAVKVPKGLIEEIYKTSSEAEIKWREAKEKNDFGIFRHYLKRIIELSKKKANYINPKESAYNVLIDDFEEGMTKEKLDVVFKKLRNELIILLNEIKSSEKYDKEIKHAKFDKEKQWELSQELAEMVIKDTEQYVLSKSEHPFTIRISPKDTRITTRIDEDSLFALIGTVHEAGHGLYYINTASSENTILDKEPSYGMHESQAMFWELQIFKTEDFLKEKWDLLKNKLELKMSFEDFYFYLNKVKPTLIRTSADEITYCLHIIIRFEIEKEMIDGKLNVEDLEETWNKKYEEYLGVKPSKSSEGILQDIHWAWGQIGYFPSYALGRLYSASLANKIEEEIDLKEVYAKKEYDKIRYWLYENVHKYKNKLTAEEIIQKATGKGLNSEDLIKRLKNKYGKIYDLN